MTKERAKYDSYSPPENGTSRVVQRKKYDSGSDNELIKNNLKILDKNIIKNIDDKLNTDPYMTSAKDAFDELATPSTLFDRLPGKGKGRRKLLDHPSLPKDAKSSVQPALKPKTEAEKLAEENARLRRESDDRERKARNETAEARAEAQALKDLVAANGLEVVETETGSSLALTLDGYDLFNRDQVFQVAEQINPRHMGDIEKWGRRIEKAAGVNQDDLMKNHIRVETVPVNGAITDAIRVIREVVADDATEQKRHFLSKLFGSLAFWKKAEPSMSRELTIAKTQEEKFRETINVLGMLKEGLEIDYDFCVSELDRYDTVRSNYAQFGDSLMCHIDAMGEFKKKLIVSQQEQSMDKTASFSVEDHENQRQRLDDRGDGLSLTLETYGAGYDHLTSAVSVVDGNRRNIRQAMDHIIQGTINQFEVLIRLEREKTELMAQTSKAQMRSAGYQNHISEIEQRRAVAKKDIVSSVKQIEQTVETFDASTKALSSGDLDGAIKVVENKPTIQLALPAPSKSELK